MKKLLIPFMALLLISSKCSEKSSNVDYKRVWMLVEFKNYTKDSLTKNKAKLDLTNPESASAYMGCNNIGYGFTVTSDDEITFSNGMATEMYCENNTLEKDFLRAIERKMKYKIDGHFLMLTNSKNEVLKFVAQDWD